MLFAFEVILLVISSSVKAFSYEVKVTIFLTIFSPPFLFVNIKLFNIIRRMCKSNMVSPNVNTMGKLKNISSCLMAIACLQLLLIPSAISIAFSFVKELSSVKLMIYLIWTCTILAMRSTLNC